MTLGTTIANAASQALLDHGQLGLLVKRDDTFDKVQGEWRTGRVTNYVIHYVPEEFSELTKALGEVAGELKIHIPAGELDFTPYIGSADRKHLEIYFGDWADEGDVKDSTSTSSGIVTAVGKTARYKDTQILWELTVRAGA